MQHTRREFLTAVAACSAAAASRSSAIASARPAAPDDLTRLSLIDVSALVRARKVSPVELTSACLARIERSNPALNAFITVTTDAALAQARSAESEIRQGRWRGPLHGVPIAL